VVSDVPAAQRDLVEGVGWVFQAGSRDGLLAALSAALATPDEELAVRGSATAEALKRYSEPSLQSLFMASLQAA